ncbi:hypothetical protein [Demequina oxidasica]|uniref:hypothetical protein n=1 Tax=Demequina oxidasica TaxID=676199 RepID=UPI0007848FED|nr:hypothetical protein [Demequina oxidasica]
MSTAATNTCARCHALVVISATDVENLAALPWVSGNENALDLVLANVVCDDCSSWYDAEVWHRTEDIEYALAKETQEALDDLI